MTNLHLREYRKFIDETLLRHRKEMDVHLGSNIIGMRLVNQLKECGYFEVNWWFTPYEGHAEDMWGLLKQEIDWENEFRRPAVKEYISYSGLGANRKDIIDGINKTSKRVGLRDETANLDFFTLRQVLHHDSYALLHFAFDYIDQFKQYNELFGNLGERK